MTKPSFLSLSSAYSLDRHGCPDLGADPNECAVRLSRALIRAGTPLDADYTGNLCRHGYARGAQDLGAFLRRKWGPRTHGFSRPGSAPEVLKRLKGVVLFMGGFATVQGHIDLWDGRATKSGAYWEAPTIWFWSLA